MSDENALLAAIWEHPHEDTPRLMYADWLQENEQPERAEFVRVQCALAQFDRWDDSPQKAELEQREKRLWAKHAKAWKAHLPPNLQKTAGFHRGFPNAQPRTLTVGKFLKFTADDLAGTPLWTVRLPCNRRMLPQLLACPHLLRVGALDIRYWLESPDDVRALATSPFVRNVATLNIQSSQLGDAGVAELAAHAAGLPNLRDLDLEHSGLTARGVRDLVGSPLADRLRALNFWGNHFGSEGVLVLARATGLARLESLTITNCDPEFSEDGPPISGAAVAELCASPHLGALKALALDPSGFGAEGVRLMCATRPVFWLRALRLRLHPGIGDDGAELLAAWPGLAEVRELCLFWNRIGDRGALALARSPHLNKVTELRIDLKRLGVDALAALRDRFGPAVRD